MPATQRGPNEFYNEGRSDAAESKVWVDTRSDVNATLRLLVKALTPCTVPALRIALLAVWVLCGSAAAVTTANASEKEAGEQTFHTHCASCHGQDGSGNTPVGKSLRVPNLRSADVQKQLDTQLAEVIANGTRKMPSFKNSLSNDQIHALVEYIRALAQQ